MSKKGLSPLAWVGIGCGAMVLVGVLAAVGLGFFAVKKGKEFVEEAERNPALATAKIVAAASPTVEVVGSDDAAQTVTLRNTETGEEVTLDFEGIKDGEIAWETAEGRAEFKADEGGATITGADGSKQTYGNAVNIPDWVPTYPGTQPQGVSATSGPEGENGMVIMTTSDDVDKILGHYKKKLEDEGYTITPASMSNNDLRVETLQTKRASDNTEVVVTISRESNQQETNISLTYGRQK